MDIKSPGERSRNMAAIRASGTKPELFIRHLLFSHGYRYRLYRKDLPGKPDITLSKYHAVIFVNGCSGISTWDVALLPSPPATGNSG